LRVGLAAVDITPDGPLALEGYGGRAGVASGTLDPLAAQALVFDDGVRRAALIAVDACGIESTTVRRIRAAVEARGGVDGAAVMVTFTHTHGAPALTPFAGVAVDAPYVTWLVEALGGLVQRATAALRPAKLGAGEGAASFNVNRRLRTPDGIVLRANPAGPVDRRVRVLRLDPADAPPPAGTLGEAPLPASDPLAVLFSYACHPTVKMADNTRYTADFPGSARRFIERVYAGDAADAERPSAVFLQACAGTLRPHLLRPDGAFRSGTDHELLVLGRLLGSEVVRIAEGIVAEPVTSIAIGSREVWLPYAERPGGTALADGEHAEVQVLRIGRHWLIATPGETTSEIGLAIERGLVELGLVRPERGDLVLTLGYANGYVGYLCSASVQLEGGYEPNDYGGYLRPAPFAADIEPALVSTALSIAGSLGHRPG
jgi:hypothetical protein